MSVKDVLKFATDEEATYVNVRFTDLIGAWHHLTVPIDELSEGSFDDGFGSMVFPAWLGLYSESDMLLRFSRHS